MAVRQGILALLLELASYGYELKTDFETRTGGTWPLNIGQVYTTLDRLERDGLVVRNGDDGEGHIVFSITDAGRAEVTRWFAEPLVAANPPRNALAIKLALAVTMPSVDVVTLVQAQRRATIAALQNYTTRQARSRRRRPGLDARA